MHYFEKLSNAQYSYPVLIFRDYLVFSSLIGMFFIIPLCRYLGIPPQIPALAIMMYQVLIFNSMWLRAKTKAMIPLIIIRLLLIPVYIAQCALILSLLSFMISHNYNEWMSSNHISSVIQ